jgi:peptidoglycan pentaglycine glycine transferase (the first glycine)
MPLLEPLPWQEFLSHQPDAHILQTAAWGDLKAAFGWQPVRVFSADRNCGAQILFRKLPLGLSVAYIPKGPVGHGCSELWSEIEKICRQKRAVFLKVEPDAWEADLFLEENIPEGCIPSRPVQPRRTIEIDIAGESETWLAQMKQKTRYNIRLAERKEVKVRQISDVALFHQLSLETGQRDGFGVHSQAYFQRAYDLFSASGDCALLLAEYGNRPLAALMVFAHGRRAWYFYGASSTEERNRMPAYLLQWEAMRWAASRGCTIYDLWGIPDGDEAELEAGFTQREDGLWGVYRFKRGFGGTIRRSVGAWDLIFNPLLYRLYIHYSRWRGGEEGS